MKGAGVKDPTPMEDAPYNFARWLDEPDEALAAPPRRASWPVWAMVAAVVGGGYLLVEKYRAGPDKPPIAVLSTARHVTP